MKYARCGVCKKTFVCNNYADRRVRVNYLKYKGVIVCPWCRGRPEMYKKFIKMKRKLHGLKKVQVQKQAVRTPSEGLTDVVVDRVGRSPVDGTKNRKNKSSH
jgi:hypothetical protein